MSKPVRASLAVLALWLLPAAGVLAASPTLLLLSYTANGERVGVPVEGKPGTFKSPRPEAVPDRWRLLPGAALTGDKQPPDRAVDLHRRAGKQPELLCRIEVRYFRNKEGLWVPHFRLTETPLVMRDAQGDWKPISALQGASGLVMLTGSSLPNAAGYYRSLDFGLTTGRAAIQSWIVY